MFFHMFSREIKLTLTRGEGALADILLSVMLIAIMSFITSNDIMHNIIIPFSYIILISVMHIGMFRILLPDNDNGILEQLYLYIGEVKTIFYKFIITWIINGLPIALGVTVLITFLGYCNIHKSLICFIFFSFGSFILLSINMIGSTLSLNMHNSRKNSVLIPIILVPLSIPNIIFIISGLQKFIYNEDYNLNTFLFFAMINLIIVPINLYASTYLLSEVFTKQ